MARKVRRKSTASAGSAATKKIGKKIYRKVSCSKTKTAAKSAAKKLRASGKLARIVSSKAAGACRYAVYTAGTASVAGKRRTRRRSKRSTK